MRTIKLKPHKELSGVFTPRQFRGELLNVRCVLAKPGNDLARLTVVVNARRVLECDARLCAGEGMTFSRPPIIDNDDIEVRSAGVKSVAFETRAFVKGT